jgi:hypothetical protein
LAKRWTCLVPDFDQAAFHKRSKRVQYVAKSLSEHKQSINHVCHEIKNWYERFADR